MKKIYAVACILMFSLSMNAQITKNTWLLGSQLSFSQQKNSDETSARSKAGLIHVLAGKAIKDNLIVGANFGFSSWKQSASYNNSMNSYSNEEITFNYGIFGRRYKQLIKDFYFFGQLDATYIAGRGKGYESIQGEYNKTTTRGGLIAVTPGLSYRILQKLQLEITLPNLLNVQYSVKKTRPVAPSANHSKQEQFQAGTSFSNNSGTFSNLGIGFQFLL